MSNYTAKDIQILNNQQASEKFFFLRVKQLSEQYPSVASDFIARILESCMLSGFDEELAVRRYLAKDKSIIPSPEFIECHKELLNEFRKKSCSTTRGVFYD
jgi:hypothetical protein